MCWCRRGTDLHVHLSHCWVAMESANQMATIYVAMACLVLGRRLPEGSVRVDTL